MSEKVPLPKLWQYLFLTSFAIVIVTYFNLLDLKANYHLYDYVATPAIWIASFSLFKLLRSRKTNVVWTVLVALILPALLLGYPEVTTRHDLYCAERDPDSFYYDPSKKDSVFPCVYASYED